MLVSILIPSRNRFDTLVKSLTSLRKNTYDNENVEYLLRFDDDDKEYITRKSELDSLDIHYKTIIGPRKGGYDSLHEYLNELIIDAKGEFYFIWNDDAYMKTKNWDKEIIPYQGRGIILQVQNNTNCPAFPIVSKNLITPMGHISLHPSTDVWLFQIAEAFGINHRIQIEVFHDRADYTGENKDKIYEEGSGNRQGEESRLKNFNNNEMQIKRKEDIIKIAHYFNIEKEIPLKRWELRNELGNMGFEKKLNDKRK